MRVELLAQRSLERVLSQRALRIGNWLPCQMCVLGFFCGVCLTSLLLAVLTSSGAPEFGWLSISTTSSTTSASNLSAAVISMLTTKSCNHTRTEPHVQKEFLLNNKQINEDHVRSLYIAWDLNKSDNEELGFPKQARMNGLLLPKAPHLENCKLSKQINKLHDRPSKNKKLPPWTVWKGSLSLHPSASSNKQVEGLYPPWVAGSDEENYPLTRTVQRDIWLHQHPMNCDNASLRFLVADFEKMSGFGIGAQIAGICGVLAIAINENRVLITNYYNRADHDGCKGSSRSRWSCYFFPETSQECEERAFKLMQKKKAWDDGTITSKENYSSKEIWSARVPNTWGSPWKYIQPTTEINGTLVTSHRKMDRRWWRAQAVRYLMRFQTEYTCQLLNAARHSAFGWDAAQMVLENLNINPQKDEGKSEIENYVWLNQKPWLPRPMLSMHVRMGDKACEMKVVEFEHYMRLAERIRNQFPQLKNIWLSTEMQEVIDKSKSYPQWNFYYTNVTRQQRNMTMASYEASLGREISTNYPLVNFLMASNADYFVGALGSTWCFLIDGMRNTGGKVMAGYLSVNKDRFW